MFYFGINFQQGNILNGNSNSNSNNKNLSPGEYIPYSSRQFTAVCFLSQTASHGALCCPRQWTELPSFCITALAKCLLSSISSSPHTATPLLIASHGMGGRNCVGSSSISHDSPVRAAASRSAKDLGLHLYII